MATRIERTSVDVRGESAAAQERSDRADAGRRRRHERRGKLRLSISQRTIMRLYRKSTTKKRRARRFLPFFLRALRFFVVDFRKREILGGIFSLGISILLTLMHLL